MAVIGSCKLLGGKAGPVLAPTLAPPNNLLEAPLSAVSVHFSGGNELGLGLCGLSATDGRLLPQFFELESGGKPSPNLLAYLTELFQAPVPFVFHDLKLALLRFWSWGFRPHFAQIYDTKVAASCIFLGTGAQDPGLSTWRPSFQS